MSTWGTSSNWTWSDFRNASRTETRDAAPAKTDADGRSRCDMGHVCCDHCGGCRHRGTLGGQVRKDKTGATLCEQCRHDRDTMGIVNKRTGQVQW